MVRTFLAIDLPAEQKKILEKIQNRWKSFRAGIRWVPPDRMHLTLKFLGDINTFQLKQVINTTRNICSNHSSFNLSLGAAGVFPGTRRPRVLWIGLTGDTRDLILLHDHIEEHLAAIGFPPESRRYSPHLTMGRVRSSRQISRLIDAVYDEQIRSAPFQVSEVTIYESILTPESPVYTVLDRCPLACS